MQTNTTEAKTRGPGRPRNDDSPKRQREQRRRKSATQTAGRLGCNPELLDHSRFVYRWLNDEPGRISVKTKNDDWDLVPNEGVKEDSTELGDMVSVVVGAHEDGSPKRAYLARKPRDYYEIDKAEEQEILDRQLAEMRRGNDASGVALSDYVPHSGIKL